MVSETINLIQAWVPTCKKNNLLQNVNIFIKIRMHQVSQGTHKILCNTDRREQQSDRYAPAIFVAWFLLLLSLSFALRALKCTNQGDLLRISSMASCLILCWDELQCSDYADREPKPICTSVSCWRRLVFFLSFFFHPAIGIIASGGFLLAFLTDLSRVLRYWTPDSGEKSLRCPERKTWPVCSVPYGHTPKGVRHVTGTLREVVRAERRKVPAFMARAHTASRQSIEPALRRPTSFRPAFALWS
jgi:hypothetical protein